MNAPTATDPVLEVDRLSYSFKNHRALLNVSFAVQPQSLHGFVGPNGAGKTTTLKVICTLLQPQTGCVRVFGNDVIADVKEVRRRIGFMPDQFNMYRQMTVYEYLDFFGAAYGIAQQARDRIIDDVLALTDMDVRRDSLINGLSRGMQQRVSLARVLVNDPDLLLLDEPASGLDPRARIELMEILQELRRMGKTIFISSHILSELAELCDSVTIIDRGTIKYSGAMDDLLTDRDGHPSYILTLGEDVDAAAALEGLPGVLYVEKVPGKIAWTIQFDRALTDTNQLLRGVLERNLPVAGFTQDRKHLNQAFMDLTERGVRS